MPCGWGLALARVSSGGRLCCSAQLYVTSLCLVPRHLARGGNLVRFFHAKEPLSSNLVSSPPRLEAQYAAETLIKMRGTGGEDLSSSSSDLIEAVSKGSAEIPCELLPDLLLALVPRQGFHPVVRTLLASPVWGVAAAEGRWTAGDLTTAAHALRLMGFNDPSCARGLWEGFMACREWQPREASLALRSLSGLGWADESVVNWICARAEEHVPDWQEDTISQTLPALVKLNKESPPPLFDKLCERCLELPLNLDSVTSIIGALRTRNSPRYTRLLDHLVECTFTKVDNLAPRHLSTIMFSAAFLSYEDQTLVEALVDKAKNCCQDFDTRESALFLSGMKRFRLKEDKLAWTLAEAAYQTLDSSKPHAASTVYLLRSLGDLAIPHLPLKVRLTNIVMDNPEKFKNASIEPYLASHAEITVTNVTPSQGAAPRRRGTSENMQLRAELAQQIKEVARLKADLSAVRRTLARMNRVYDTEINKLRTRPV
eukprot:gb/GEZN01003301.1/.p1 GENE.gb/GEZN01003301.1/~~gb/GEZN01003301.1/.p1  ORF type:complete len:485 (-),score=50.64 gb/GEZN01003301.1/:584-2038(-)